MAATERITLTMLHFTANETTFSDFESLSRYLAGRGKPGAF
ncbi:hypothetical protein [Burkholderia territorii]|nr:hypothetical protein [Burkholderia territorii]